MKFKKIIYILYIFILFFSFNVNAELDIGGNKEKDFYNRVLSVYDGLSDKSSARPEYVGGVYYVSNRYANMKYDDFTEDYISEIFSYMKSNNSSYTITENDNGELDIQNETETSDSENSQSSSEQSSDSSGAKVDFPKYSLTDTEIKHLAAVCKREQGSLEGAAAEASLMANLFEYNEGKCPSGKGDCSTIYKFVKNSKWFGSVDRFNKTIKNTPSKKYIAAVKNVLVNGKRTLPRYVNEHDCWNCNSNNRCSSGIKGDICKLDNNGKKLTSMSDIKKRSNYVSGVTKIYNVYGSGYYTFYTFPTSSSDPFGYTNSAYNKFKEYGDGHYKFDGTYTAGSTMIEDGNDSSTVKSTIDLEYFVDQLVSNWFSSDKFEKFTDEKKRNMAIEAISYVEEYKVLMGIRTNEVNNDGICSYSVNGKSYSDLRVQLLRCEGNAVLENTALVDFEKYITGVVSQENGSGPYEALKAQAVAARSYSLKRPKNMNGAYGVKYDKVDGFDVINLRSCTNDQVYCDPDEGCWSEVKGGQTDTSNPAGYSKCTVYQKEDTSKTWHKAPLSQESEIRKATKETKGQVAVDSSNDVVYTPYIDSDQQAWNNMANNGSDYYEILKKHYADKGVVNISSTCSTGTANTEAESWLQGDPRWGGKYIGDKTLKQVGCMITSTAIQIARSGTKLNVSSFDPGVFLDTIKAHNGVSENNFNVDDNSWASIAPNFKVGGVLEFSGSDSSKIEKMQQYITGNKYLIIRLYHPGQHWVAVTGIENGKIKMADPACNVTDFASRYSVSTVSKGYYFVKND